MSGSVSAVVVCFHGRDDLERTLPALLAQGPDLGEVLVVDNGPGEDTAAWVEAAHPQVTVVRARRNVGYAGGVHLGARRARGSHLLVVNQDALLLPGAVAEMRRASELHPGAIVTPKILQADGRVNACGVRMHYGGITTCAGLGEDPGRFRGTFPVPLASGAVFLLPRALWEELGGFDARFFMYMEDVDLSLRARLRGGRVVCAAEAVALHDYDLAMSPRKFHLLERNRLLTLLRVYDGRTLRRLAPGLLLTEAATWCFAALRGPAYLRARAGVYGWLWRHRAAWLADRARIQASRRVPDAALLAEADDRLAFGQLVRRPAVAWLLDRLTTPLFRAVRPSTRPRPEASP